ncbi:hypothetical protein D2V08_03430 [Flagellimonas lutimaris]|uniref:Uncharacterized protein n=1 Tax=Flagellimonas lutimaris TaxID=475082 RepID=A0A3A1NCJ5_9FLAO|nr:hypothetical protein [Allomuricauda lutimaris]RIV36011.1 hypothetical protein D2V08_03430 [Allomuricauda lutimaris]
MDFQHVYKRYSMAMVPMMESLGNHRNSPNRNLEEQVYRYSGVKLSRKTTTDYNVGGFILIVQIRNYPFFRV